MQKMISVKECELLKNIALLSTRQLFSFSVYIDYLKSLSLQDKEASDNLYRQCVDLYPQTYVNQQHLVNLLMIAGYLQQVDEEESKEELTSELIVNNLEVEKPEASIIIDLFSGKKI